MQELNSDHLVSTSSIYLKVSSCNYSILAISGRKYIYNNAFKIYNFVKRIENKGYFNLETVFL